MTTLELKNTLIKRITEIDDISLLQSINTILDSKSNEKIMNLSTAQREAIMAGKRQIEQGLFITHEELNKEIKAWLKEK